MSAGGGVVVLRVDGKETAVGASAATGSPEASANSPERRMSSGVSGEILRAERSSSLAVAGFDVWSMLARAR